MPKIFCAIDTPDLEKAMTLSMQMKEAGCGIKLGMEFFYAQGPQGVEKIMQLVPGVPLFLDLKLKDIPNTVAKACRSLLPLQPAFITLHVSGGFDMMRLAADALRDEAAGQGLRPPKLLGVTLLTSMDEQDVHETGLKAEPVACHVLRLAKLAQKAELDGVVCAGHETAPLRQECGQDFILMVPGIRPAGADNRDQKRVMTPQQAIEAGATHLVIGRPVTQAPDPARAAADILSSLKVIA